MYKGGKSTIDGVSGEKLEQPRPWASLSATTSTTTPA
jgi:hypothetical protein